MSDRDSILKDHLPSCSRDAHEVLLRPILLCKKRISLDTDAQNRDFVKPVSPIVTSAAKRMFGPLQLSMPFELLRYDPQTYEPVRTPSGRCTRAPTGK